MAKKLTKTKAREILHDKEVHGQPLTDKQRRFFGAIAGGAKPYKAQKGDKLSAAGCPKGWINVSGKCFDPKSDAYEAVYNAGIGYYDKQGNFVSTGSELPEVVVKPEATLNFLDKSFENPLIYVPGIDGLVGPEEVSPAAKYAFDQIGKKYGFPKVKSQYEYSDKYPINPFSYGSGHYWDKTIYADDLINYIGELAHYLQDKKSTSLVGRFLMHDLPKYIVGDDPYTQEGTVEHEAHSIIQPRLEKEFGSFINDYFNSKPGTRYTSQPTPEDKEYAEKYFKNAPAAKKKQDGGAIEGTMGGLTDKGFNFNPAWGGAWKNGGKLTENNWLDKYQDGGTLQPPMAGANQTVSMAQRGIFLEPNSPKLPKVGPSSELAMSIGGENGEPAYLIPSMKYGRMQVNPMFEFMRTGEHLGGPFKTWQEADEWERTVRHPYVEKGQSIPTPYKRWGQFAMGGSLPGSVGFTYARTAGASPSEGPYAKKTLPSAQNGIDASKKFLTDWYSNRKITDPYIQGAFDLDRPGYMKNLQSMPGYTMVESIDNNPNITGRYDASTNKLLITKGAPEHVKTHELNHYLNRQGGGDYMRTIHGEIVKNELLPQSQVQGVYKDKYDYFSNPDEVHSRIMVLREKAGIKPNEVVTPEKLKGFMKTYKGDVDNINDLLNMSKGEEGLLNMLNFMAKGKTSTPTTAQNGAEMSFYQQGLDWKPKTISRNGKSMKKAQFGTKTQIMGDLLANHNLKSKGQIMREADIRREAAQASAAKQPYSWMNNQSFVGPSNITESTRITNAANTADERAYQAFSNSPLVQTMQLGTPSGHNTMAGIIGASTFTDMNPITGPATAAGRLVQQGLGYNPYGFGESTIGNILGGASIVGDIFGAHAGYKMLPGSIKPRPLFREEGGDVPKGQTGLTQKYSIGPTMGDLAAQSRVPTQAEVARQNEMRKAAVVAKKQIEERNKVKRFIENQGTISEPGPSQSGLSRAWEIATNPIEAFGYAARNERLPENFSKARTRTTALDDLAYMVNPLSIPDAAINTVSFLNETGKSIYSGDLPGATTNLILSGINAIGALPAVGAINATKNVAKDVAEGFKKTWAATPDLANAARFKNALNAGAVELRFPNASDISGHSYFDMTPDQVAARMADEIKNLPKGSYTVDRNMSTNSAPLFWNQAARLADKNWTMVRPGTMQELNSAGNLGRRVASAIPEEAADAFPQIIEDYNTQVENLLNSGVPSMIRRGRQMQKEGVAPHILSEISFPRSETNKAYYHEFLKNYKPTLDEGIVKVNQKTGLNFPMTEIDNTIYPKYGMPTIIAVKGNPLGRIGRGLIGPWKDYFLGPMNIPSTFDPSIVYPTFRSESKLINSKLVAPTGMYRSFGQTVPALIPKKEDGGGVIKDNMGYWNPENWGKVVEINSNNITMRGVDQPLLGISDVGDTKLMQPGKDYKFKGKKVKEYPVGAQGVSVNKADEAPLEKLDNLLNFTNYNKPKAKSGKWLDKYK